jgi:hypothetical protein
MNKDKELELELVEVEPDNKLEELSELYNKLNAKCDLILNKIHERQKKKTA